ncbi:MAG TPA: hypothetical protein VJX72_08320 [Candidatus Acidoferrum sp.]|nr:hypothetical protein [Candidatus Acidoferrum sp.]
MKIKLLLPATFMIGLLLAGSFWLGMRQQSLAQQTPGSTAPAQQAAKMANTIRLQAVLS